MKIESKQNGDEYEIEVAVDETYKVPTFDIFIEQESDFSSDGGHSFETTVNSASLNRVACLELIIEIEKFLKETE